MKDKSAMKMREKVKYDKQGNVRKKKFTKDGVNIKVKNRKKDTKVKMGKHKVKLSPGTDPEKYQYY